MSDQVHTTGRLKVLLGYAAGVGKTYRMLEELHKLRAGGHDVAVGYFEPHGRAATIALIEGLELIPRRRIEYRGCQFEEMDVDAILRRRPRVCAVDEFPHTNVPGSERTKRWEDVRLLLAAGIDVLTTMNIQHLESLNDQVREITGIVVRETIPDWVLKEADEVVLVDLPPPALLNRLERGAVYGGEKAQRALDNFFRAPVLAALRELAIRQTAQEVDTQHPATSRVAGPAASSSNWEKILILIDESAASGGLIRRARRVADFLLADCLAVCRRGDGSRRPAVAGALAAHMELARRLRIETSLLPAACTAGQLVDFARRQGVTQLLLNRPAIPSLWLPFRKPFEMEIVDAAKDMHIMVVARRSPGKRTP